VYVPGVTVYIVNHNYGRFVEKAIESVLGQTYRDFELIIIDDGSTDDSRTRIEQYADDPKIMAVFQQNKGLTVTNNIALRAAKGRYIMRLDADDWLDPHALMVMTDILDRDPSVGMVFPNYNLVDEEGHPLSTVRRHDFGTVTLLDQPAHGACTLIRRSCLDELGGYDENLLCQDGVDLWIRFIQRYRVSNVDLPLFYYRQHSASLTRNEDRLLSTRARILEKHAAASGAPPKTIAIIPVRGPSVDPHSIALEPLGDKPLVAWTVEAALASSHLVDVVLTSPCDKVLAAISDRFGNRVIKVRRPARLAQANTLFDDAVRHAVEEYEHGRSAPEAVAILGVDSPFLSARFIDSAINVMALYSTDSVIGVRPETDAFYQHDGGGMRPLRPGQNLILERDELYRESGQLRLVRRRLLEKYGSSLGERVGHIVVDQAAALKLRSQWDWDIAQFHASRPRTESSKS
jgi:CMP-N-acetylneuraminic acid synthetase